MRNQNSLLSLKKETSFITSKNGYEELMDINEEGEKTTIYLKQNKNGTNEFILVNRQKEDFNLIFIIGKLTLQKCKALSIKKHIHGQLMFTFVIRGCFFRNQFLFFIRYNDFF